MLQSVFIVLLIILFILMRDWYIKPKQKPITQLSLEERVQLEIIEEIVFPIIIASALFGISIFFLPQ